jgi:hypothetical protein
MRPEAGRRTAAKKEAGMTAAARTTRRRGEQGQSVVIVALALFAMLALLAVTFDGANAYFQRRMAQTASDAGALAGARELCVTDSYDAAVAAAHAYAEDHNQAVTADVVAAGGIVSVTSTIDFPTTFGNVLGMAEMSAVATAAAGCLHPTGANGILPIAYSCEGDIGEEEDGDLFCTDLVYGPENLYIIMDSNSLDEDVECISDGGTVDCDPNGDGIDEVLVGGNRSWLDLSGSGRDNGNGSSELCYWIEGGYPGWVRNHTWYGGQVGVSNNLFQNCVADILMQPALLPVFDAVYEGWPPLLHDEDVIIGSNGNTTYFHVISFAMFVPTCVRAAGNDRDCTLYNYLDDLGGYVTPSTKTLEGYFIQGFVSDIEGAPGGVDTGVYTIALLR